MIHKKTFFDSLRTSGLHKTLSETQVAGYEAIIDYWERVGSSDVRPDGTVTSLPIEQLAYVLATAYHETGGRIEPVREGLAKDDAGAIAAVTKLFKSGRISRNYALPDLRTGKSYYGRGLVQLTFYENYKKAGQQIGRDLVNNPDEMLRLSVSVAVLVEGMKNGLFSGKRLSDYIVTNKANYRGARRIINGTDKAEMIAGYAAKFESALRKASQ